MMTFSFRLSNFIYIFSGVGRNTERSFLTDGNLKDGKVESFGNSTFLMSYSRQVLGVIRIFQLLGTAGCIQGEEIYKAGEFYKISQPSRGTTFSTTEMLRVRPIHFGLGLLILKMFSTNRTKLQETA